jgi:diketogulonate reductase-like aldo/keto reductase
LGRLGLDYVDLYLLHWPVPTNFEVTVQSYRAAERLLKEGRTRAIGVSNFSPVHLTRLLDGVETVPAVNQIELHPFFTQREAQKSHARLGIVTQAWSPLGGSVRKFTGQGKSTDPLSNATIIQLAKKHRKTPAQVILRWHLQHGICAIPKSFRPERIGENIDVFDFALSPEEVASIDRLDTGARSGPDPDMVTSKSFPISVPD